jgi:hypothetical protein
MGERDDLYLAARNFAGGSKISFHQSSINRFAVNSKTARPPLIKWSRPRESVPGWTVIFGILIPPNITYFHYETCLEIASQCNLFLLPKAGTNAIFQISFSHKTAKEEGMMRLRQGKKLHRSWTHRNEARKSLVGVFLR